MQCKFQPRTALFKRQLKVLSIIYSETTQGIFEFLVSVHTEYVVTNKKSLVKIATIYALYKLSVRS